VGQGTALHGFGVGPVVLRQRPQLFASTDSMSWSMQARAGWGRRLPECRHAKCTSCLRYALRWWRTSILPAVSGPAAA
jgi:hypothetical protein